MSVEREGGGGREGERKREREERGRTGEREGGWGIENNCPIIFLFTDPILGQSV